MGMGVRGSAAIPFCTLPRTSLRLAGVGVEREIVAPGFSVARPQCLPA